MSCKIKIVVLLPYIVAHVIRILLANHFRNTEKYEKERWYEKMPPWWGRAGAGE